jgi:hypothetical protein
MSDRRATMAKRQREQDQKDRVREREARRAERRERAAARAASGLVGPEIAEMEPPEGSADDAPAEDFDGPPMDDRADRDEQESPLAVRTPPG